MNGCVDGERDEIGGNDLKLGAAGVRGARVISRNLALMATVFRRLSRSRGRRRRVKLALGLDRAGSHSLRCHRAKDEPKPTRWARVVSKTRPEMIPDVICSSTGKGVGGLDLTLVSEDLWP